MSKAKPDENDLRRLIGYTMITFMGVFLFVPILWFVHLFSQDAGLFTRWIICSAFLVVYNVVFYYWKYPVEWFGNLLVLIGIDMLILIFEYFWQIQSMR